MTTCPRPEKIRHATKQAALAAIRSLNKAGRGNPDMTAYRCVCGSWHIGHDLAKFTYRIRRAVRAGNRTSRQRRRRR